jgi:hypothetical protein
VAEIGQHQHDALGARVQRMEEELDHFRMMHEPIGPRPAPSSFPPKDDALLDAIIETIRTE